MQNMEMLRHWKYVSGIKLYGATTKLVFLVRSNCSITKHLRVIRNAWRFRFAQV